MEHATGLEGGVLDGGVLDGGVLDVAALLGKLTVEEKAALVGGADFWHTFAVERLGIPAIMVTDGPHGLRKQVGSGDHAGIEESVPATCFPPAAGLASSWDRDLMTRVGIALGDECRAEQVAVLLGPGVNMKRSPLCGRNFEYFSEDPLLAGDLAAGLVSGVQSRGVGTALKHFAANNQETDRMSISAEIDERTLREIYLAAFERVVSSAQPWTIMCSYNRINGVYASENRWLLTDVLRREWGFGGLVMSDWGAVNERPDGVRAGLDLEMPSSDGLGARKVLAAVAAGELDLEDLDRAVANVLTLVNRVLPALAPGQTFDADAHHALAREAATASAVLLKNDGDVLPLDPHRGGPIAVIGEFARTPRYQGTGSSQVQPTRLDDALTALRAGVGGARELTFSPGFALDAAGATSSADDDAAATLRAAAVSAAAAAEVVVLFLGLPSADEAEGYDREHLDLPAVQVDLLEAVAAVNENLVVVLANGSVVRLDPWQDRARAVLEGWLLGQAGGSAIANLVLGAAAPAGRLAETIPRRLADNPTIGNFPGEQGTVRYGEGLLIGYRWYDAHHLDVAYPLGHGLTYTTFAYSDLAIVVNDDGPEPVVTLALTVANTGSRAGREVVQVYVGDPECTVFRPERELRAYALVDLTAGESARVTLTLGSRAFAFWHLALQRWVVEGGEFAIGVGASSRDLRLTRTVQLSGEDIAQPLTLDLATSFWLEHPRVGPRLRAILADDNFASALFDPQNGRMMQAIPMRRLARFPGFPLSEVELDVLAAQ